MLTIVLAALSAAAVDPPLAERTAIFAAAGFRERDGQWRGECDDPGTASYEPGRIERLEDLNGDGSPEAIVTEGSTFCYGAAGTGFTLLSRSVGGRWSALYQSEGVATVLDTRATGWPEIEVGGPGFCFAILRWTGKVYEIHRHAYQGKACKP